MKVLVRIGICVGLIIVCSLIFNFTVFKPGNAFTLFGLTEFAAASVLSAIIGVSVFIIWTVIVILINHNHKLVKKASSKKTSKVDKTDIGGSIRKGWDKKEK